MATFSAGCYSWDMIFRASSGLNNSVCDIWTDGGGEVNATLKTVASAPPGVYRDPLINQWTTLSNVGTDFIVR